MRCESCGHGPGIMTCWQIALCCYCLNYRMRAKDTCPACAHDAKTVLLNQEKNDMANEGRLISDEDIERIVDDVTARVLAELAELRGREAAFHPDMNADHVDHVSAPGCACGVVLKADGEPHACTLNVEN